MSKKYFDTNFRVPVTEQYPGNKWNSPNNKYQLKEVQTLIDADAIEGPFFFGDNGEPQAKTQADIEEYIRDKTVVFFCSDKGKGLGIYESALSGADLTNADKWWYVRCDGDTNCEPLTDDDGNYLTDADGNILCDYDDDHILLDLVFQDSIQMIRGSGSATFTRSSVNTYYDDNGLLQQVDNDTPCYDADTGGIIISGNHGEHTPNFDFSIPDGGDPDIPIKWDVSTESGNSSIKRNNADPIGGVLEWYLDVTSTSTGVAILSIESSEIYNNDHYNAFYLSCYVKADNHSIYAKVRAISSDGSTTYYYTGSAWSATEQFFLVESPSNIPVNTWTRIHQRLARRPSDTNYTQLISFRMPVTSSKPIKFGAVGFTAFSMAPPVPPSPAGSPIAVSQEYLTLQQSGNIDKTAGSIVINMKFVDADNDVSNLSDNNILFFHLDNSWLGFKVSSTNQWRLSDGWNSANVTGISVTEFKEYGGSWDADNGLKGFIDDTCTSKTFDGVLGDDTHNTSIKFSVGNLASVIVKRITIYDNYHGGDHGC